MINMINLKIFKYNINPLFLIPTPLNMFFQKIKYCEYDDLKNIYNTKQQDNLINNIKYIFNNLCIFKNMQDLYHFIFINKILSENTKKNLIKYSNDLSIHSIYMVKFSEILMYVFTIIDNFNKNIQNLIYESINQNFSKPINKLINRIIILINCLYNYDKNIITKSCYINKKKLKIM